jgi:hypothetical protein
MFLMSGRMDCMPGFLDLSMEAGMVVSGVVYGAGGAVCFKQLVVTFNFIAITFLSLLLDVMSVWILHSILKFILSWSLKK